MAEPGNAEAVRARFAATAAQVGALEEARRAAFVDAVGAFVQAAGDERALDAGAGTGALAFALAPHVREVVALDLVPELLAEGRRRAPAGAAVEFVEGDAARLPFPAGSFDLAGCARTLHHTARPERVVAELTRVVRPGGRVLVIDQIAPTDPLRALALERFERARDASHARCLSDADLRGLFEANGLVLLRERFEQETRDLDRYLDLAGCAGDARREAEALAPPGRTVETTLAWYLLAVPGY